MVTSSEKQNLEIITTVSSAKNIPAITWQSTLYSVCISKLETLVSLTAGNVSLVYENSPVSCPSLIKH